MTKQKMLHFLRKLAEIFRIYYNNKGGSYMGRVFDIANFFIDVAIHNEDDCMTNLRLNKLLYFSQAWALVKLGRPLFSDEIEAWEYGPVIPLVYHKYKYLRKNPIKKTDKHYSFDNIASEEQELLFDIMREYGQYTTPKLVDITHEIGSPWYSAFHEKLPEIAIEAMESYFSTKQLKSFEEQIDLEKNLIGYLDDNGIPVLPVGFDDEWKT